MQNIEELVVPTDQETAGHMILKTKDHHPDSNRFQAHGIIVHRFDRGNVSIFTIKTATGRNHEVDSYINITFFKETLEKSGSEFKVGDHVIVNGKFKSFRPKNENTFKTSIVGSDIQHNESDMERLFGVKGRVHGATYNKAIITGEITKNTMVKRGLFKLVIRTKDGENTDYINCTLFAKNPKSVASQIVVGNKICALGEVQTWKKESDGKATHFQDVLLLDITEV